MSYATNKKWRQKYPEKRRKATRLYYKKLSTGSSRHKSKWMKEEEKIILSPLKPTDRILSKLFKRSVNAIQVHRSKLKRN